MIDAGCLELVLDLQPASVSINDSIFNDDNFKSLRKHSSEQKRKKRDTTNYCFGVSCIFN